MVIVLMYQIQEIQDVSRPQVKRYVAHVAVETKGKRKVKRAILEATEQIRRDKSPAHVVWLYVSLKDKLLCRTMWSDPGKADAPMPKPLDFNDSKGDIGIVWV